MSYPSQPVCWSWPVPALERAEEVERLVTRGLSRGAAEMVLDDWAGHRLARFHDGRCAVCPAGGADVEDHDHRTGLVRGHLCRSCNRREPYPQHAEMFDRYRERPPAVILGISRYYVGYAWTDGWWENEVGARMLTGNPGWVRVTETDS